MDTIRDLLRIVSDKKLKKSALIDKNAYGNWIPITYDESIQKIYYVAAALVHFGYKKGDKIAIFSHPSSHWFICHLAIAYIGCVSVPIHNTVSPENFAYYINSTNTKTIFYAGRECEEFCKNFREYFGMVVSMDDESRLMGAINFSQLTALGSSQLGQNPSMLDIEIDGDDLISIMFTSGSGFQHKGVELTHRNVVCQLENTSKILDACGKSWEKYLNFLPLTHLFGRLINLTVFYCGGETYYIRDVNYLTTDCQEVNPTLILFVPRLIQKFVSTFTKKIEGTSYIMRKLSTFAFKLANNNGETFLYRVFKPFSHLILYSKVRGLFGRNLKLCLLGGAKSDRNLLWLMKNLGFTIFEGYGLTEAFPVSMNSIENDKIGTVGKPLRGVDVKISSDGEILVKGNVVMRGYYLQPELTRGVIDEEGWLHTKDLGTLDAEGNIVFINPYDERGKTSYGIFIDTPKIEGMLNILPFVNYSLVIVNDRPYATCLIFPNTDALQELKKQLNLVELTDQELMAVDFMKKTVKRAIHEVNSKLDEHERIRAYKFIFDSYPQEHMTQTLKIRRQPILDKYKSIIDEMYSDKIINIT